MSGGRPVGDSSVLPAELRHDPWAYTLQGPLLAADGGAQPRHPLIPASEGAQALEQWQQQATVPDVTQPGVTTSSGQGDPRSGWGPGGTDGRGVGVAGGRAIEKMHEAWEQGTWGGEKLGTWARKKLRRGMGWRAKAAVQEWDLLELQWMEEGRRAMEGELNVACDEGMERRWEEHREQARRAGRGAELQGGRVGMAGGESEDEEDEEEDEEEVWEEGEGEVTDAGVGGGNISGLESLVSMSAEERRSRRRYRAVDIDRRLFAREHEVLGLRVSASECAAAMRQLRASGCLLEWPRTKSIVRTPGDDGDDVSMADRMDGDGSSKDVDAGADVAAELERILRDEERLTRGRVWRDGDDGGSEADGGTRRGEDARRRAEAEEVARKLQRIREAVYGGDDSSRDVRGMAGSIRGGGSRSIGASSSQRSADGREGRHAGGAPSLPESARDDWGGGEEDEERASGVAVKVLGKVPLQLAGRMGASDMDTGGQGRGVDPRGGCEACELAMGDAAEERDERGAEPGAEIRVSNKAGLLFVQSESAAAGSADERIRDAVALSPSPPSSPPAAAVAEARALWLQQQERRRTRVLLLRDNLLADGLPGGNHSCAVQADQLPEALQVRVLLVAEEGMQLSSHTAV